MLTTLGHSYAAEAVHSDTDKGCILGKYEFEIGIAYGRGFSLRSIRLRICSLSNRDRYYLSMIEVGMEIWFDHISLRIKIGPGIIPTTSMEPWKITVKSASIYVGKLFIGLASRQN